MVNWLRLGEAKRIRKEEKKVQESLTKTNSFSEEAKFDAFEGLKAPWSSG